VPSLAETVWAWYPQRGEGSTVNHRQDPRQRGNPGAIVLLVGVCALVDFLTPSVFEASRSPEAPMVFTGALAGQFGLLAVWAVLGPQRLSVRWPLSLLVAVLLCCALLLGVTMIDGAGGELGETAMGMLTLPMIFLAVQVPLWILRIVTGWCIVAGGREDCSPPSEPRQFQLQHMLGATTAVAVALGLASVGLRYFENPTRRTDPSMWLGLMFACLMCGVWSAFSTLPCFWAAFVARNKMASAAMIAVYAVLMSLLVLAVMSAIYGSAPPGEVVGGFILFHGSLAFVLLGSLHLARLCGYVLLRPGRIRPPVGPRGSSPFADSGNPLAPPRS